MFSNKEALLPWMGVFKRIMDRELPAELSAHTTKTEEMERREKTWAIKLKGIASRATHRIISKYGNKRFVDEKYHEFSDMLSRDFGIEFLKSHLTNVLTCHERFVGTKALNFSLKYLQAAYKNAIMFEHILPFTEKLLKGSIIHIIMLQERDYELFTEDEQEFIRKQQDFQDTLLSPKNTAIDLLQFLCQMRTSQKQKKPAFLHNYLAFLSAQL